ncbi:YhgE/Pip family protein [Levilactobacillus brevis]|uniref:YhgE/Pip family protein n=1 Tax=Levilactobacillus brevis TaxID=1580 RepID=UPI001DF4DA3E|nr:YhgE/Pip family protein [Levilactobacillus brevis]
MLKSEWQFLKQHKMMLVVLVMIAIIPAIYCYLYLSAMWNTYGHVDELPVAVVNHDHTVTEHGHRLAIGQQLATHLRRATVLDFRQLSAHHADQQLRAGKLYLVVTVPRRFSHDATTLISRHPQQLTLHFTENSGTNFIVSKMTAGAANAITAKVSRQVTKIETQILLQALRGATTGMRQAAKGSAQLTAGSQQLLTGIPAPSQPVTTKPATNLAALQSGLTAFHFGNATLSTHFTQGQQRLATISTRATTAAAIAQPVVAKHHDVAPVPNNGTGMAPFAIAIGLYVGGIALGTMYDANRTYRRPRGAIGWWGSKAAVIGSVAFVQSLTLDWTLRQANTLTVQSQDGLFAALLLGSILFLSLIFCLRLLLNGLGTWLISIVLVAQLASSGGLYPLPLVSPLAQALNPWLPMTYLIQVLRAVISTNTATPIAWLAMISMTIGFNLLIILKFHLEMKRQPLGA